MKPLRGLYPIVDTGVLERNELPLIAFAEAVLSARPVLLQLRAKDAPDARILLLAKELSALCAASGTTLVLNDRPDLAFEAGVRWVHVGQDDMPALELQERFPSLSFGISTHSLAQLHLALLSKPSYVAYGPVFDTLTKENPDPTVGLGALTLAKAAAGFSAIPLVAIGGIREEHLAAVAAASDLWAVISALVPPPSFGSVEARLDEVRRLVKVYA